MAYTTNNNSGSNNALYFIVGGLVVLALIFGLFFYNGSETGMNDTAPAAGLENTADNVNPVTPGNQDMVPDNTVTPAQ
jgi:hypothetical protein